MAPERPGEPSARFTAAIAAIDAANADDPHTISIDGVDRPKELAHAELMSHWVQRLDPAAGEEQLLAARAHHLRRWTLPRSSHPDGRAGYLRWRRQLREQHAADVASILEEAGYGPGTVGRVQAIVRKEDLRTDPQVQTHEDALCLVFLQTQFEDVAGRLGADKTVDVLTKTLAKMSERGRRAALELPLGEHPRALLDAALARSAESSG